MKWIAVCLMVCLVAQPCLAWHEPGHHIIALLAYDLLNREEQRQLQAILRDHPRFAEDFVPSAVPSSPEENERWLIGRAGYWPDVARSQPAYNRPTWHYQLGATLTIGDPQGVPQNPGPAPADASLETQELHIAQAVEVCRLVLRDKTRSTSDRAIAICWLAHLVGDAHQPCHAGSLYVAGAFPEGDRGANSIPTKQSKNLHALWDGLLGSQYDAGDIRRRCEVIRTDATKWTAAEASAKKENGLNPLTWLAESSEVGRRHVYTPEVLEPVQAVSRGLTTTVATVDLSDDYLTTAGDIARKRAAFAGHRLALILSHDLR
ncbi:MAG: S1/P1 nuclease [Planctomycetaceae bacterium]|nr:S1/P1 nuclease [Planctomycetaceae bacterium]